MRHAAPCSGSLERRFDRRKIVTSVDAPRRHYCAIVEVLNTTTFVDLKSIRAGNGYRLMWVKEVFKANPQRHQGDPSSIRDRLQGPVVPHPEKPFSLAKQVGGGSI